MRTADYTLAPDGAFVVQFAAGSCPQRGAIAGRVEHVQSGRASRFYSAADLLAFFGAVLALVDPADAMAITPARGSPASVDESAGNGDAITRDRQPFRTDGTDAQSIKRGRNP